VFSFLLKKFPASREGRLELQKGEKTRNRGPPLPGRIEDAQTKENPGSRNSQESGTGKRTAGLLENRGSADKGKYGVPDLFEIRNPYYVN